MDRIIKFRAWDIYDKRMYDCGNLPVVAFDRSLHPIMQFTGLHDKNNVEIYEGDIIRDGALLSVVKWDTPFGRWCAAPGTQLPWKQCIVVGNVFENPEININKLAGPTTGQA